MTHPNVAVLESTSQRLIDLAESTRMSDPVQPYLIARNRLTSEYADIRADLMALPLVFPPTRIDLGDSNPIATMSDAAYHEMISRRSNYESQQEADRIAQWVRRLAHNNYIASIEGARQADKASYKARHKATKRIKRYIVQDTSMSDIESAMLDAVRPIDEAIAKTGNPLDFGQYDSASDQNGYVVLAASNPNTPKEDWRIVRTSPTAKGAMMTAKLYHADRQGVQTHIATRKEAARLKLDELFPS